MYYLFSILLLCLGTCRLFPTLCSGTTPTTEHFMFPTTLGDMSTSLYAVLEDCADHRIRLRSQPCSGTCPPVSTPCSGTVSTTEHVYVPKHAQGLVDQSLCRARGLCWPPSSITFPTMLGDSSITPCAVLGTCFDYSPTIAWGLDEIILIF